VTSKPPALNLDEVPPELIRPALAPDHIYWKVWCHSCAELGKGTLLKDYVETVIGSLVSERDATAPETQQHHPDCIGNLARACKEASDG